MIYRGREGVISYIIQPVLFCLIILGIFGLVMVRSSIIQVEYQIGTLEKEKAREMRARKSLIAKRASALSFEEVEVRGIQAAGLSFPDRKRVFYVKRHNDGGTYSVSIRGSLAVDEQEGGNP